MKRLLRFAALPLAIALPLAAQAQEGVVSANIGLRAGPAPEYPEIMVLLYGADVSVQGCTGGWSWCDVITDGARGWIPGDYIEYDYDNQPVLLSDYGERIGIPIVVFSIGTYWDNYYRDRPFYRDRGSWYHRRIAITAPPPPPRLRGGLHSLPQPAGGGHHVNPPNPPRVPVNGSHSHGNPQGNNSRGDNSHSGARFNAPQPAPPRSGMQHELPVHGPVVNGPPHAGAAPSRPANASRGNHPQQKQAPRKKDNNDNGH
ncbi:MAG: SH3 domain-containing protein [Rhodanobacteraceae bacterium]